MMSWKGYGLESRRLFWTLFLLKCKRKPLACKVINKSVGDRGNFKKTFTRSFEHF